MQRKRKFVGELLACVWERSPENALKSSRGQVLGAKFFPETLRNYTKPESECRVTIAVNEINDLLGIELLEKLNKYGELQKIKNAIYRPW